MAILVKTSFDYGDEFDCKEFTVFENEAYERWIAAWERQLKHGPVEVFFGTNEELQIDSFDQFEGSLEIIPISEAEYQTFKKFFDGSWGTGGIFSFDFDEDYLYADEDEDGENEDDGEIRRMFGDDDEY
jgi:hypothetical protein